jgi:hypothetical protein
MGWRNHILSSTDDLVKYSTEARRLVGDGARDASGRYDLDEVVRNLISAIKCAGETLGVIYESCGPFLPPPDKKTAP